MRKAIRFELRGGYDGRDGDVRFAGSLRRLASAGRFVVW
jgi:hypothetical protein